MSELLKDVTRPVPEQIPLSKLFIDERTQRPLMDRHATELVANYNVLFLGVLVVSQRTNGMYAVLDGQHRMYAITRCDAEEPVTCLVFKGLTLAQEAEIFLGYNTQGVVHRTAKFTVQITAGDPGTIRIGKILDKHSVEPGVGLHKFSAIVTAVRICGWPEGEQTFDQTMGVLSSAWAAVTRGNPYHGSIVMGMARLIHRYGDKINMDRLKKVLDGLGPNGPTKLLESARTWGQTNSWTLDHNVAMAAITLYNANLARHNQIPVWDRDQSAEGIRADKETDNK